tara:strand:- start:416 stop:562 length:147 start_codon:yes stop_codon:yes gene_type:complete
VSGLLSLYSSLFPEVLTKYRYENGAAVGIVLVFFRNIARVMENELCII